MGNFAQFVVLVEMKKVAGNQDKDNKPGCNKHSAGLLGNNNADFCWPYSCQGRSGRKMPVHCH